MSDFDDRLRTLLEQEGAAVAPDTARLRGVVGRVRRKRAVRAASAGLAACIVVAGGFAGAATTLSGDGREQGGVASQPSELPFGAREGTYPVIATGTFEGSRWTLSVIEDPDAAHPEDTESENPEISFEIEGEGPGPTFETYDTWDVMTAFQTEVRFRGDDELVMGMVDESVASVTVETDDGESIAAPIFDGGDEPVPATDYYLVFFPAGTTGELVARDSSGAVMARRPLRSEGPPTVSLDCDPDHAGEDGTGGPSAAETERFPVLGRGTVDGKSWTLRLIEDPDAAHPEDTESENPEVMLEVEGTSRPGGTFETYDSWEGLTAFHSNVRPNGGEFVMGMVTGAAASVTFEGPDGDPVPASLSDARGVARPGTQVYVVFLPEGARGDVIARDAGGDVVGRSSIGPLPEAPNIEGC